MRAKLTEWGVAFETQTRLGRWYADLYVPLVKLVIEVNGCYYHSCQTCGLTGPTPNQPERDARKLAWLRARGYRVLVVWEHDFKNGQAHRLVEESMQCQMV